MDKRKIITVIVTAILILGLVILVPSSPVVDEVSGETSTVTMSLIPGWNLKGMPKIISASDLCDKSSYISTVVRRGTDGNYDTYVDALKLNGFMCGVNEGVYIWVDSSTTITFAVDLERSSGYTRGDLWIDGNLAVAENVTLDNNLQVNGTMTITGTFSANDLNVVGNLTVDGELTTQGNLTVGGSITIVGDMSVGDNLFVDGDSNVTGNSTVGGYLSVDGNATFGNDLTVNGDLTVIQNLTVLGDYITENYGVTNLTTVNLTVTGNATGLGMMDDTDYIIYKDDAGITYARNMSTGVIDFQSSNATYVIQSTLDNMPDRPDAETGVYDGGKIGIREGNYDIDYTLNMSHGISLIGAGLTQTQLNWVGGAVDMITVNYVGLSQLYAKGGGIYQLRLIGNYNNDVGIRLRKLYGFDIDTVSVFRSGGDAIEIESCYTVTIFNSYVGWGDASGIHIKSYDGLGSTAIKIISTEITAYVTYGVHIETGLVNIDDCYLEGYTPSARNAEYIHIDWDSIGGVPEVYITNNHMSSGGTPAYRIVNVDGDVYMAGNVLNGGAVRNRGCVEVQGGTFRCISNHFESFGNGIDITGDAEITIIGNLFLTDGGLFGVYSVNITATTSALIEGNHMGQAGVYSTSTYTKVIGNHIEATYEDYAIYCDGSYSIISGNLLMNPQKNGIYIDAGNQNIEVTGNNIFQPSYGYDDTYDGISTYSNKIVISGNSISSYTGNSPRYGISLTNEDYCIVTDNNIDGMATADIYAANGNTYNLITNNIVKDGTISVADGIGNIIKDNIGFVNQTIHVGKDLHVGGNLSVDGGITVGGNISVTGNMEVTGNLTVTGDIIGATGRAADFVIAAYNAPQWWKDQADKQCDGIADDVEIQEALDALYAVAGKQHGTVMLSGGYFNITATIDVPFSCWLIGQGGKGGIRYATLLDWTGGADEVVIFNEPASVSRDQARGGGIIGISIDGNDNATVGIIVRMVWHVLVEDIAIRECDKGFVSEANINLNVKRFDIMYNNGDGMFFDEYGANGNTFITLEDGEVGNNGASTDYNLHVLTGVITMTGMYFENSDPGNIHIYMDDSLGYTPQLHVSNSRFQDMGTDPVYAIGIDGGMFHMSNSRLHCGARLNSTGIKITDGELSITGSEITAWGKSANGGAAIDIDGGTSINIVGNRFIGGASYGYAFDVSGGTTVTIADNTIWYGGINISTDHVVFSNNHIYDSSNKEDYCIYIGGNYSEITGNYIQNSWLHGIYSADNMTFNRIVGNRLYRIAQQFGNYYGIYVGGNYTTVDNNHIFSDQSKRPKYGIFINETYNTTVTGNFVNSTKTYDIYSVGGGDNTFMGNICPNGLYSLPGSTGDYYRDNIGFVTENWGYNASIENGFTVTHGLAGTPTSITITLGQNGTVWVSAKDATTFTVGLPTGSYDIYWYAIYRP